MDLLIRIARSWFGRRGRPALPAGRLTRLAALGGALWAAAAGGAEVRPVRVCLPPAEYSIEWQQRTAAERLEPCLSLFFRERLARLPGVEVLSEDWARTVLFFCGPEMRGQAAALNLAAFRAGAPVDVVLLFRVKDGVFACTLLTATGAETIAPPASGGTLPWAQAIAARLGPALGLDAPAVAALAAVGAAPPRMVEACLLSQRIATGWVYNAGEAQLASLRPFVQDAATYPDLAAALLRAGVVLSTDSRKPENPNQCVEMLRLALVGALGTAAEPDALAFMRRTVYGRDVLEKELLDLAGALATDEADLLLAGVGAQADDGLVKAEDAKPAGPLLLARQVGAVRCLAGMGSPKLAPLLPSLATHAEPAVRAAVAHALADPTFGPEDPLAKLTADADAGVAFAAQYALWRRGRQPDAARAAARALFDGGTRLTAVPEVLTAAGTLEDEPRLRRLLTGTMVERRLAFAALARLGRLTAEDVRGGLESADAELVAACLKAMDARTAAACRDALVALANQSYGPIAESARRVLWPLRPADAQAQAAFDLDVEHLYLRLRAVERLAAESAAWAVPLLERATANPDPQVRAQALLALQARAPDAALKVLPRLLTDPAIWVRVHASSLAAALKTPALKDAVASAHKAETDAACRLYLERALGQPPPPAVNGFDPASTRLGLCGYASRAAESPLGWYYNLRPDVDEAGRRAHAAGKTLIGRTNSIVSNPVQVLFDPLWRDRWWTNLRRELADLQWLDGVVLGEETMYARPWQLWDDGWRCFCVEAGIAAETVAGDRAKLTPPQSRAYLDWEQERQIDGFNRMYEFIKLDQGAHRPGFLVGTFMPDQNGPNIAEPRWKFDVGGAYWYQANNRVRYNMIRRHRTLWPGRPLMYLVSGNAGLPLLAPVNYKLQVPTELVRDRGCNAYADAACAWAAGAEPGFFVAWLFMGKDVKPGPTANGKWVWLEDVAPDSTVLAEGIANVWRGVADQYRLEAEMQKVKETGPSAAPEGAATPTDAGVGELDETDVTRDEFSQRAAADEARFRRGFFLEQKALYDVARVFSGLPKPAETFAALLVGGRGALPQFAALPGYDMVELVNLLPRLTLAKYRLVGIEASPEAPLRDETLAALRAWLRDQPGLLYLHGFLSTDNANEASTAADHDGRLREDWPWEDDVLFQKDHYTLRGPRAKALAGDAAACTRALWRGEGDQGAVLFDCGKTTAEEFQAILTSLHQEQAVGVLPGNVPGMIPATAPGISACVSNGGAAGDATLAGVDLFTGEPDPVVARTRSAAITADGCRGTYVAAYHGVTILCDAPIQDVKPVAGGLEVNCPGLIRASSARGEVHVQPEPPRRNGTPDEILDWILFGRDPGWARLPAGAGETLFVRAQGPLHITVGAPE